MKVLKRFLDWEIFGKIYMYTSIIAGILLLQVSTPIGVYVVVHGVIIAAYPVEEEAKIGKRVVEGACICSFVILVIASIIGSVHLVHGVLALFKNPV